MNGGGGQRYLSEGDHQSSRLAIPPSMDDQQLDAAAALTSFSQGGFGPPSAAVSNGGVGAGSHLLNHHHPSQYPPERPILGRKYSDSASLNSAGTTSEYPYRNDGAADMHARSYYLHEDSHRSAGSYHSSHAAIAGGVYRSASIGGNGDQGDHGRGSYRRPSPAEFGDAAEYPHPPPVSVGYGSIVPSYLPRNHEDIEGELPYRGNSSTFGRSTSMASYHSHEENSGNMADSRGIPYSSSSRYPSDGNDRYKDFHGGSSERDRIVPPHLTHHRPYIDDDNKAGAAAFRRSSQSGSHYSVGVENEEHPVLPVVKGYDGSRDNLHGYTSQSSALAHRSHKGYDHAQEGVEEMQEDQYDVQVEAEEDDDDDHDDDDEESETESEARIVQATPVLPAVRGKPEAIARAQAAARVEAERLAREQGGVNEVESLTDNQTLVEATKKKRSKPSSASKKPPAKKPANRKKPPLPMALESSLLTTSPSRREFLLGELIPPISEAEHQNLQALMTQFCRVPLLSEFSRPVSILHPEVAAAYSKIILQPVDLGHVSRGIRRRQYKNCRDIRLDMWRVFANCVKYNSHPSNKDAVPSFVSIALHLREYFNNLWQEYMLPSDPPSRNDFSGTSDGLAAYEIRKAAFTKRDQERKKRLENSGVLVLSKTFTTRASVKLLEFIESGGRVDGLDDKPLFGAGSGVDSREVDLVVQRLGQYHAQLEEVSESGSEEYSLDAFYAGLSNCYTEHVLEDNPAMRNRFQCRLDRFFWKQAVPLHEANSRGVTQSSIWGNLAATIWARESSKKVFWPALCLGILPPAEQREGWHQAVTERNEGRLPEKLRGQLMVAKKRCEQAQKRLNLSYFLVEFLGTHEFIWVRETDIIENFDPNNDPNKAPPAGKKSRTSRSSTSSVVGSKTYQTALQECAWANEEYENVLQDAFENSAADDSDEDNEEMNYSFNVLAQSDEEADENSKHGYEYVEEEMDLSDVEEANYLITNDGLLDTSAAGRKGAKKRTLSLKKKVVTKKEPAPKKEESPKKKRSKPRETKEVVQTGKVKPKEKQRNDKKEQRELDKRRKRRLRAHEKSQKSESRKKAKRRRSGHFEPDSEDGNLHRNKRSRATAIVKAYLTRTANQDECRSLALNGVMTIPAALVDSTGLLGMALAFRAANGVLSMPDDGQVQITKMNPWKAIDTDQPKTSAERTSGLQKQLELLEKEIARIRKNYEHRMHLASEYVDKRLQSEAAVANDDFSARYNHYKKKRKATPSKLNAPESVSSPIVGQNVIGEKLSDVEAEEVSERMEVDDKAKADDEDTDDDSEVDDSPESSITGRLDFHKAEDTSSSIRSE